jgi:phosphonate degradation associated HDIG domain protein
VQAVTTVDDVLSLYERRGGVHYDDDVTQLDHALQSAALAESDGASDELVAAALLHDVGHLLELDRNDGAVGDLTVDRGHEATGSRYLAALFPPAVVAPIALHVRAKRYLCAAEPAYAAALSDGSVRSLSTQGGPMPPGEMATFEQHPAFAAAVAVRRWDDLGKVDGLAVPGLDHYEPVLRRVAGP